jgi:hypothetical protein
MSKKKKTLSASRIKTLDNCSWYYWCNYHLKLPQKNNAGALRGTLCHLIFELLLNPKHRKHYDVIIKKKGVQGSPAINRLVTKHLVETGLWDDSSEPHYDMCCEMILTGLKSDFFCEGGELLEPEFYFKIENEDPKYKALGYIDKAAIYKKDGVVKITDYKSSKSKFEGDDLAFNIQAMIYSLVALKTWPELKPKVEFKFLRFASEPNQTLEFEKDELMGLEYYLAQCYEIINSFDEEKAVSNYAADKPWPSKAEGFKGPLSCGFAKRKGQLKKDGNPMWHCPYKFDFEYYALVNGKGEVVESAFNKKDLKKRSKHKIEKKQYEGCPRHKTIEPSADDDFWT